jgi:hypothetical protein
LDERKSNRVEEKERTAKKERKEKSGKSLDVV